MGKADISSLSIREKVLQTVIIRVTNDNFNPAKVGGVFFGGTIISSPDERGVEGARALIKKYIDNADIPILVTSDFESGCGGMFKGLTAFPYEMSLGAANDEQLAYDYGKATAMEARSVGANWTLSPVSDLNLNPWNPLVGERTIGDDPDLTVRLLKQVVRGMQENGIAACAKHFPGDGVDFRDQHRVTTYNTLSMEDWRRLSGRVFKELIEDGVYSIMAGHIGLPAYQKERLGGFVPPATLSYELITELLKGELGFEGVVVTDALGMGGMAGFHENKMDMYIDCFNAGCDMMLWPSMSYVDAMVEAVESGRVSIERLDDAVRRIFNMKEKLGLFDRDNAPVLLSQDEQAFVRDVGRRVADASMTLLRDNKKIFPLNPLTHKRIAIVPVIKDENYNRVHGEAELLASEFERRGFEVGYYDPKVSRMPFMKAGKFSEGNIMDADMPIDDVMDSYDAIIYAFFTRTFRPSGPEDFCGEECIPLKVALTHAVDKTIAVSFGSPYLIGEYFERGPACVNAYSMVSLSVEAFVRAACGEIEFSHFSPVDLVVPTWTPKK